MKNFLHKIKVTFWGEGKLKGGSAVFVIMTVLSCVALIISNILAGKSFPFFGLKIGNADLVISGGILIFPVTYILSDLFSEVYGYSASRRVTWLGFAMNVIFILFMCAGIAIPGANFYYQNVVSDGLMNGMGLDFLKGGSNLGSLGILIASLLAFTVGSWIDDVVFEKIKKYSISKGHLGSKAFILRAVASSFAGEIVDTTIFVPLLYLFTQQYGTTITGFGQLMLIILIPAIMKTLYELVVSPFTAFLAKKLKAYESMQHE